MPIDHTTGPQGPDDLEAMCQALRSADLGSTLDNAPQMRLFSTWEICRYLMPVTPAHLRRVLRQRPDLPQGRDSTDADTTTGARWFTLDEVMHLREAFAQISRQPDRYLPPRPAGATAPVIAVAQLARAMGRSTVAHHLAAAAAMAGYRVLAVDLDPQASLTQWLGGTGTASAWSVIARQFGTHLRQDNQRRLDRGEAPLPLDPALDRVMDQTVTDAIRASDWPGVDLLAADSALHALAWQIPLWQRTAPGWPAWAALRDPLRAEGVQERYDLVVVDTGPDMGPLTQAALAAAQMVLVPLVLEDGGVQGAQDTLDQVSQVFRHVQERETLTARALGRPAPQLSWNAVRLVLNQYDPAHQAERAAQLQARLGAGVMPQYLHHTPLIGTGEGQTPCVYAADYRDTNRERFATARASFDAMYQAVQAWMVAG